MSFGNISCEVRFTELFEGIFNGHEIVQRSNSGIKRLHNDFCMALDLNLFIDFIDNHIIITEGKELQSFWLELEELSQNSNTYWLVSLF